MTEVYDQELLNSALHSESERVAIWAAYQLLLSGQRLPKELLHGFLESSVIDIQEGGINKISQQHEDGLVNEVVRCFLESEGQLKYAAAFALSQFPNDITIRLLAKWFDQVDSNDQCTRTEVETAAHAYLAADPGKGFGRILEALQSSLDDLVKSVALLSALLPHSDGPERIEPVMECYFYLREQFSDSDLVMLLHHEFGSGEVAEWLTHSIGSGYPLSQIYSQAQKLFWSDSDLDMTHVWTELDKSAIKIEGMHVEGPQNLPLMLLLLKDWLAKIGRSFQGADLTRSAWLIDAFMKRQDRFERATPKMIELEAELLLSLPIAEIQRLGFQRWVAEPSAHFSDIANYYHSTLLTHEHCEELLRLFFPEMPDWSEEELTIVKEHSPLRERPAKAEVLWALFRGELSGYDLDWPSLFPNPSLFSRLGEILTEIYRVNFAYYLNKRDRVAVDYALKLFQKHPDQRQQALLAEHAKELSNHHGEMFYQTLEFLPDLTMGEKLLAEHRTGELEQAKLIRFIYQVYGKPVPAAIEEELKETEHGSWQRPVRLHCEACDQTFQYRVDEIFVDEGAIHRMNRLGAASIWVRKEYHCKSCNAKLRFLLDAAALEELYQQSRIDRLLNMTQSSPVRAFGYRILLIDFPRFEGKSYNPGEFIRFVGEAEEKGLYDQGVITLLKMKLARLYRGMEEYERIIPLIEELTPGASLKVEWHFMLGQAHYKSQDFPKARKYLEAIAEEEKGLRPETADSILKERALFLLKAMNNPSVKRARFQVLEGKK